MEKRTRFTDFRKRQGLTQQQAADLAMISRRQVQKIENGESVGMKSQLALAEALGIPTNERLCEHENATTVPVSRAIEASDALLEPPSEISHSLQKVHDHPDFRRNLSAAEVEFSIRRMRRSWLRHLERSNQESPDIQKTQLVADQRLNDNVDEYVERYMEIWRRVPDAIQISRVNGRKTGISVVLPVSLDAYLEVRLGQRSFMDVRAEDLQVSSGYLVIDSLVEFDDAPRRKWFDVTSGLRDSIVWQVVNLAGYPLPEHLRILSFGASQANAKRLQSSGFVDIGQPMKDLGYQLLEFARDNSDLEDLHTRCESGMFFADLLGRVLSESATLTMGIRVKRAAIMGTMQLLQNANQFQQNRKAV